MQIFIDSADVVEIKECWEMGVIDGVTTNPSLAAKTGEVITTDRKITTSVNNFFIEITNFLNFKIKRPVFTSSLNPKR